MISFKNIFKRLCTSPVPWNIELDFYFNHQNVFFCVKGRGWRVKTVPHQSFIDEKDINIIVGADGRRNLLKGFKRKEFRGKLAIGITVNFVNRKTQVEAAIEEISGVAFIYNQQFFQELKDKTGIDLENIVYYKDDTHYFVMTAKKNSLIKKGVIIQDNPDAQRLLAPSNVSHAALCEYAKQAVDFSTHYKLPHHEFALNHYGKEDVAMFDFTSMHAAENASRIVERKGKRLFMGIVGDTLIEVFVSLNIGNFIWNSIIYHFYDKVLTGGGNWK